jgi:hypothetical protein
MSTFARLRENPGLVLEAMRDVPAAVLELNRLYYSRSTSSYNADGIDVFDQEWDNLIILDACRCDYYAEQTRFDGPLECRRSRGSASNEFIRGNFSDRTLHDVVYVSGNRWFLNLRDHLDCELHAYRDVERDFHVDRVDGDDEEGYVPYPETVMEAAAEAAEEFPEKRLLIHLMQPHKPYLGPHSDQFTYEAGLRTTMQNSEADTETLRAAYRETLDITLDTVGAHLDALEGLTVISADHGELLGERASPLPVRWYGHPEGVYVPELVEVPWHVVSEGPRRTIRAEPPQEIPEPDEEEVTDTLRALGYVP